MKPVLCAANVYKKQQLRYCLTFLWLPTKASTGIKKIFYSEMERDWLACLRRRDMASLNQLVKQQGFLLPTSHLCWNEPVKYEKPD